MPPQNPINRIEHVARDLGTLAAQIERYAGPDARRTLLYWQAELLAAIDDLQRSSAIRETARAGGEHRQN